MYDASLRITEFPETLRHQVTDRLRSAIRDGRLPEGSRLVERPLCDMLGVSRTLVREALRQLEVEGYVVNRPRQGLAVAELDTLTVRGIYEVRAALEALGGSLFVKRATKAHRDRLRVSFAALGEAHDRADPAAIIEATATFYDAVFEGAQNEVIRSTLRPLGGRIQILRSRSLSVQGRRLESRGEMDAIHAALHGTDPDVAWRLCWDHVVKASTYALRTLELSRSAEQKGHNSFA